MRDEMTLLFGFGALLHPSKLTREPDFVACKAPNHRLAFSHKLGFATLEPLDSATPLTEHVSPGCAFGACYSLRASELEALQRKERGCEQSQTQPSAYPPS